MVDENNVKQCEAKDRKTEVEPDMDLIDRLEDKETESKDELKSEGIEEKEIDIETAKLNVPKKKETDNVPI